MVLSAKLRLYQYPVFHAREEEVSGADKDTALTPQELHLLSELTATAAAGRHQQSSYPADLHSAAQALERDPEGGPKHHPSGKGTLTQGGAAASPSTRLLSRPVPQGPAGETCEVQSEAPSPC